MGADFKNQTAKEHCIKGKRVGQIPCSSIGEVMESKVNPER